MLAGTANLARGGSTDFAHASARSSRRSRSRSCCCACSPRWPRTRAGVAVRIGRETQHEGLLETSFVTTGYGGEGDGRRPHRLDRPDSAWTTPGTMASVRAVARYLSRILAG